MKNLFRVVAAIIAFVVLGACASTSSQRVPQQITGDIGEKTFSANMPVSDESKINILGASGDGRYVAFFESVIQDGSGFPSVTLRIIDNIKDTYIFSSNITKEDDWTGSTEAAVIKQISATLENNSQKQLKQYKIVQLNKLPKNKFYNVSVQSNGTFQLRGRSYTYELIPIKFMPKGEQQKVCAEIIGDTGLYGFSLSINGALVYRDNGVPKSRGCSFGVNGKVLVFVSNATTLFFVQNNSYGFEGVSKRFIAIPVQSIDKIN